MWLADQTHSTATAQERLVDEYFIGGLVSCHKPGYKMNLTRTWFGWQRSALLLVLREVKVLNQCYLLLTSGSLEDLCSGKSILPWNQDSAHEMETASPRSYQQAADVADENKLEAIGDLALRFHQRRSEKIMNTPGWRQRTHCFVGGKGRRKNY